MPAFSTCANIGLMLDIPGQRCVSAGVTSSVTWSGVWYCYTSTSQVISKTVPIPDFYHIIINSRRVWTYSVMHIDDALYSSYFYSRSRTAYQLKYNLLLGLLEAVVKSHCSIANFRKGLNLANITRSTVSGNINIA